VKVAACADVARHTTPSAYTALKEELPSANHTSIDMSDRLCGLAVRVTGNRSRGPDSIPGAIRFSEK
jgi:hypothetical protein